MENSITLINLTPHDVHVITEEGTVTFPASGTVARMNTDPQEEVQVLTKATGIPVYSAPRFVSVTGLPKDGISDIIVSMPVAQYLQQHRNVYDGMAFTPDTGPGQAVRNEQGQIIGVKRLVAW